MKAPPLKGLGKGRAVIDQEIVRRPMAGERRRRAPASARRPPPSCRRRRPVFGRQDQFFCSPVENSIRASRNRRLGELTSPRRGSSRPARRVEARPVLRELVAAVQVPYMRPMRRSPCPSPLQQARDERLRRREAACPVLSASLAQMPALVSSSVAGLAPGTFGACPVLRLAGIS